MEEDKTLFEFEVMHIGWEVDNTAWIKQNDAGEVYLVMTDHGSEYIGEEEELEARIREYKRVLADTQKALGMLQKEK